MSIFFSLGAPYWLKSVVGRRSCPTTTNTTDNAEYCTDNQCIEIDVDYVGSGIGLSVDSAQDCSCACHSDNDCAVWIFVGNNKNFILSLFGT